MTVYAEHTKVPVARSLGEIQELLTRYGASSFANFMSDGMAGIVFETRERRVKFELPLPKKDDFKSRRVNTGHGYARTKHCTPEEQHTLWEQACRQKWRALALVIKAKLEAVESGITTFEDEFLAHIVLPNGKTLGKVLAPQLADMFATRIMPPLLGSGE